jgi:hypothetical protein
MVAYYSPLGHGMLGPTVIYIFEILASLAVCLFALWRGQRDQQIIACVFLISFAVGWLMQNRLAYRDPDIRDLWIQGLSTPIIVWLAVRSGALWLIIEAALQVLCVTTIFVHHYARDIIGAWPPWELGAIWSLAMNLVLFIATLMAARRAKTVATAQPI